MRHLNRLVWDEMRDDMLVWEGRWGGVIDCDVADAGFGGHSMVMREPGFFKPSLCAACRNPALRPFVRVYPCDVSTCAYLDCNRSSVYVITPLPVLSDVRYTPINQITLSFSLFHRLASPASSSSSPAHRRSTKGMNGPRYGR